MAKRDTSSDDPTDVILDSIADGVFTVDEDWRITSFNRAAERITGVPRDEAIGRPCCDVFRASICETDCALRRTLDTGAPVVNRSVYIINADGARVPISISTAILRDRGGRVIGGVETFRDLSLVEALRKELDQRHTFADIISRAESMQRVFAILPTVAESSSTVLVQGESGTGKELVARALHNLSPRAERPFVTVNCGALPDTLLESELFGHRAGAFTDARTDRQGRFAAADGGTIFLDEIGDVSPALQVRLLRVIQDGAFEALGESRTTTVDVRVVAATHRDLQAMVEEGAFRRDLYYRINVVRLVLPPLRERIEDVPLLVDHFVRRFNALQGKDVTGVSPEAMEALLNHDYPGNVRELENVVEHAFVLCPGGRIEVDHLPADLAPAAQAPQAEAESLEQLEARFLRKALERNRWSRRATAAALGIHPTTLWRKIKRLGITLPPIDGRSR